jgi:hypothetical protein
MANVIFDIAAALSDCICVELKRKRPEAEDPAAEGWSGDCCVHPGSGVAFERCCDGNAQAWVTALDGLPTVSFPTPDGQGLSNCDDGHTFVQRYELGALRCVAWGGDDGTPPNCERKEQDALNVMGDLTALLRAVQCCLDNDDRQWRLQEYHLIGPEGVCVASVVTIAVEVPAPCCLLSEETP